MKQSTDDNRGFSRVSHCKRRFGCRKVGSHFHVENYSSASARTPFSQSGPFTCCDDAYEQIEGDLCASAEQQMQAVLDAMDAGMLSLMEDAVDHILDPDNGQMVAEGLEVLTSTDELRAMERLYRDGSDDDDGFPEIVIETPEPPPIRRRSQQPAMMASGEIGSST